MNDLLKEAIADAKAVRETALANAKIALEEAFTPRIQSMLSAKLAEDEDMTDEPEIAEDEEVAIAAAEEEPVAEGEYEDEVSEDEEADIYEEEGEEVAIEEPVAEPAVEEPAMEEEEDMELEAIIKELEDEAEMSEDEEIAAEEPVAEAEEAEDSSDISIDEIIKALREEEGEEEITEDEDEEADVAESAKLSEAYNVIKFLKSKINEVNLLNAKLLFSNKLFRNYPLNESQKMKVIENFDRASSLREVKLVYTTLCESLVARKAKKVVKESYASKPSRSTAPKKEILSEGNQLAARWKKLANLK